MPELRSIVESGAPGAKVIGYFFWCPGCKEYHAIWTAREGAPKWTFDNNLDRPTFSPSLLIVWGNRPDSRRCHSFIRNGKIEFCSDSSHELSGKTADLPDLDMSTGEPIQGIS